MNRRWRRLQAATPQPPKGNHRIWLSKNDKTGWSINVPIVLTCYPTLACSDYCYGLGGRIRMDGALRRQAQNYAAFERLARAPEAVVESEALLLAEEVLAKQEFIRFFGVGDLQPGSVRFINALSRVAPKLSIWVSTRRFDLADGLCNKHGGGNVHVMLSLDSTTPPTVAEKARALAAKPGGQFFLAYVQQSPDETPPADATVVFAEHRGSHRAAWTSKEADPRTCPATIRGGADHEGACGTCRTCFTDKPILSSTLIRPRTKSSTTPARRTSP